MLNVNSQSGKFFFIIIKVVGKRQSEKRKMELYDQDIHSNIVSFREDLSLVDDLIYQFGAAKSTVIWASTSSSSLQRY